MQKSKMDLGMLVQPSRNSRSKTKFWSLNKYIGEVISLVSHYPYIEVRWYPTRTEHGSYDGGIELMKSIDLKPYE